MRLRKSGHGIGSLPAAVENEAQKLLPHGKAKRHRVAETLGHSERTLTRRLADENTTYEEVVDQLRRSLALQYVKEPSLSVSQIAWLLGYEGSSSFNHAFVRWTGRAIRHAQREAASRAGLKPSPAQTCRAGLKRQKIGLRDQVGPSIRSYFGFTTQRLRRRGRSV